MQYNYAEASRLNFDIDLALRLYNKVALIDDGKIIAHDTLQQLMIDHKEDGLEGLFINLTGKSYRDS